MKKPKYYIEVQEGFDQINPQLATSYWWRVRSRNGLVVLISETYITAAKARQSARRFGEATGIEVTKGR